MIGPLTTKVALELSVRVLTDLLIKLVLIVNVKNWVKQERESGCEGGRGLDLLAIVFAQAVEEGGGEC